MDGRADLAIECDASCAYGRRRFRACEGSAFERAQRGGLTCVRARPDRVNRSLFAAETETKPLNAAPARATFGASPAVAGSLENGGQEWRTPLISTRSCFVSAASSATAGGT